MPTAAERIPQGVRIHHDNGVTVVRIVVDGVASVGKGRTEPDRGLFAEPDSAAPAVEVREDDRSVWLHGGGLTATISKTGGTVSLADANGRVPITEAEPPAPLPGLGITATQAFTIGVDEALHGLGQFRQAPFDYRDADVFLAQSNSDAINPFLVSSGGWGLLWDTGTAAHFRSRGRGIEFHSVAGATIRYHVVLGTDLDEIIRGYRRLTGAAPLFGRWAYGYWQSQERYRSAEEVIAVVDGYRSRGLPLDGVVLDWRYWGDNAVFSGMGWDRENFADPAGMVDEVHRRGAHLIASIWPALGEKTAVHQELDAGGLLFDAPHWSGARIYDSSSPQARRIYWRHLKQGLIDVGLDGLWTDGSEPEFMGCGDRYLQLAAYAANGSAAAGPIMENLLTFSYYHSMGLYRQMQANEPSKRPFILSRSAYAGQQAFGTVTWSGDIFASWQTLRDQLVAAQNFSMSGIPYWTCDIGAFLVAHRYPDNLTDPAYRELYVRWFQFGSVLPIFRAHGTEFPRQLWAFGEAGDPCYDAMRRALELRYSLIPYIYSNAAAVTLTGDTMLRGLVMDFPDDPDCRELTNQFLFGRQLMARVADRPLIHPSDNAQEFLPHDAVRGVECLAAEVSYFVGADFERHVAHRLTDDLKLGWAGDLPPAVAGQPYSIRWTGRIAPAESGAYTLSLMGKGDVRLILDGELLLHNHHYAGTGPVNPTGEVAPFVLTDPDAEGTETRDTVDVVLEAGRLYGFTIELRQPTPDVYSMWFEWISPTQRMLARVPEQPILDVRLPAGTDWYDFRTGERFAGGQTLAVEAPLDHLPLYARAGAIIPMTPGVTQAGLPATALHLRVHPGADGTFILYDDEGDGDGYTRGAFVTTPLTWSDADQELIIGPRSGSYPGMPDELPFTVTLVSPATVDTAVPQPGRTALVIFNGERLVVGFAGPPDRATA